MSKGEIMYNIYWDWKAVQRTLPPEAVKGRLLSMGFEFDESEEAYVIPKKMSSDVMRGSVHSLGLDTVALKGTCVSEEVGGPQ